MLKVAKFGGSSMADAKQFEKVRDIVRADPARKVIVVSAAGKRSADDHKLTDLLYLCYAHLQYGVNCDAVFQMICDRYIAIRDECGLNVDIEAELDVLRRQMRAGISEEELVSRGEYFSALLMADYLGYSFLDAELWVRFQFDGSIDKEASYAALRRLADGRSVVIPGFYGVTPDRKIRTFSRGGSDITGALAAAALDADVYENWTDVSGILMADPRIVPDPLPIERITYNELRELSFVGRRCCTRARSSPCARRISRSTSATPTTPTTPARSSWSRSTTWTTVGSSPVSRARKTTPSSRSPSPVCPRAWARSGRCSKCSSATA